MIGLTAEEIYNTNVIDQLRGSRDQLFSTNDFQLAPNLRSHKRNLKFYEDGTSMEISPSPGRGSKESRDTQGSAKLSLRKGYDRHMAKVRKGEESLKDIIEDEFEQIHQKIDGIMHKMDIDSVLVEDDVNMT